MKGIFMLGPYGNLTTLYGNTLALHPSIFGLMDRDHLPPEAEFYTGENVREKYDAFLKFVESRMVNLDLTGQGSFGTAHFSSLGTNHPAAKELGKLYGYRRHNPEFFIWKEPGFLTSEIRKNKCIHALLNKLPDIVFVRPVRNPLHCLQTNLVNDHYKLYDDTSQGEPLGKERAMYPPALCHWYLRDLDWFLDLQAWYPERFILHFENDKFEELMAKLNISCGSQWLKLANQYAGNIRPRESNVALAEHFREAINLGPYAGDAFDRIQDDFITPVFPAAIPPWEVK